MNQSLSSNAGGSGMALEQFRADLPKPACKRYCLLRAATVAVARAATVAFAFAFAFAFAVAVAVAVAFAFAVDAVFDVDPR
jgi:uncharacterized membrane protein YdbT with pleckstrin-like domain